MQKLCPKGHVYNGDRCNVCYNTASRGYDHRWRKLSEHYRVRNPLCEDCDAKGVTTPSTEVHHIIPISQDSSKRLDINNLVALCTRCHEIRHGMDEDLPRGFWNFQKLGCKNFSENQALTWFFQISYRINIEPPSWPQAQKTPASISSYRKVAICDSSWYHDISMHFC